MANNINIVVSAQVGDATKGLMQVQQQVQRTDRQIQKSTKALKDSANQFNSTAVATNKWAKGALQQAGYQVGDFAVQLGGGQNAMQAFAQQGSQLAGIFGPMGAVIGAAIAIFGGLAAASQRASEASDEATESIGNLSSAFSKLERIDAIKAAENLSLPARRAVEEYSDLLDAMQAVAMEERASAISDILGDIAPLDKIAELQSQLEAVSANRDFVINQSQFMDASEGLKKLTAEQMRLMSAIDDEAELRGIILSTQGRTRQEASQNLQAAIASLKAMGRLTPELRKQLIAYGEQAGILNVVESTVKSVNDAVEETTQAVIAQSDSYIGQDAIFRSLAARQANMAALANDMKQALQDQNKFLSDEDALMSQIVVKANVIDLSVSGAAEQSKTFANEMQRAANAVMGINVSAFSKLEQLQAELRGRTRGLGDNEIRVMQAARAAEMAAKEAGVDSALELAAISSEAARIERQIIAAESGLLRFNETAGASANAVRNVGSVVDIELTPAMKRAAAVGDMVGNSMEAAMMSIVDGTKSVKDAFKSMASEVIKELYRIFVVKKITGLISGFIADPAMFGGLGGTSPVNGSVMPTMRPSGVRAMGGQVTGNKAYMVGERGPEMVVPSRNSHVVPNNQMGGGGVTVVQNINVSTGVQQTVRTEIRTLMPQIAEAAKSAVADAKLRGGSYGRSFA